MKRSIHRLGWCIGIAAMGSIAVPASAQQDTSGRAIPSTRIMVMPEPTVRPSPDTVRASSALLPKIDLPEYVITGSSTIDLPPAEKEIASGSIPVLGPLTQSILQIRERSAAPPSNPPGRSGMGVSDGWEGRAAAGLGTFFTPALSLWMGRHDEQMEADGMASYHRTKGWSAFTDRSGFSMNAGAALNGTGGSPFVNGGRLAGRVGYETETYNLYGSTLALKRRLFDRFGLDLSAQNLSNPEVPIAASLSVSNGGIKDSTNRTSESDVAFRAGTWFRGADLDWEAEFRYDHGSISGLSGATLSRFELMAATLWKGSGFTAHTSIRLGAVEGMGGQRMTRIYPNILAIVPLNTAHTLELGFQPSLVYRTFLDAVAEVPYITGRANIEQSDLRQRWTAALRSAWTSAVSSVVRLEVESQANRPYLSDTAGVGVWDLFYSGGATIITLRAEGVANVTANDYFVSGLLVRSANHSDIGYRVPFEPEVEAGVVYRRRLGEAVSISPSILIESRRPASPSGTLTLPALFRADLHAEWARSKELRITLDLTNVTDRRNERWRGYADRPFTVTAGVEVCW